MIEVFVVREVKGYLEKREEWVKEVGGVLDLEEGW